MFLNFGDVLHRRSEYIKKLQADFDPLSRFRLIGGFREIGKNRVKQKHANVKAGVNLAKVNLQEFFGNLGNAVAPQKAYAAYGC